MDADTHEWFFIEVNPRIQVEHTVTEVVTGIDLVRSQILIAQGLDLHGPEINLPPQEEIPLHGYALQCRVTTEDPANNFMPDYGKILTYRSPAGFGIRLDGGIGYGGAVITPFYDSLLVKVTAWGREFPHGLPAHGPRAARVPHPRREDEHSVPGKRRQPPAFPARATRPRVDRRDAGAVPVSSRAATAPPSCCTYLGDVIVNGNPEVPDKPAPHAMRPPPVPAARSQAAPPAGTRQLLIELGPEKFAEWTLAQKRLLITDTTFRDAHQSLMATRVRTYDMLAIAELRRASNCRNLFSLEMWGGATFDIAMRFLHEDPWERLRRLREAIPNICFQMLLRGSNAVGYSTYPDNVVAEFILRSRRRRASIFSASSIR